VKAYVARKCDGSWSRYVEKLERQSNRMTKFHDDGKTAVIKTRKFWLSGYQLIIYGEQIRQRGDVKPRPYPRHHQGRRA